MKLFDAQAIAAALPWAALIRSIEDVFSLPCVAPLRHVHQIAGNNGSSMTSLIMPAWIPGKFYGVKVVNIAPQNGARGLPGLYGSYLLFDANTGQALAMLDGAELTARRTAASSALAASRLARADARHLLVVGAGKIASLLPGAYNAVLPLERVSVWSRTLSKSAALVSRLRSESQLPIEYQVVSDLQQACRSADVVSCATLATEPIIFGNWLSPGSHLDLIGSFTPQMREADDECFRDASLFVDSAEALTKSGDLIGPLARGVIQPADVRMSLAELCRDPNSARRAGDERTVFKSVGLALEDLAAALLIYTQATE